MLTTAYNAAVFATHQAGNQQTAYLSGAHLYCTAHVGLCQHQHVVLHCNDERTGARQCMGPQPARTMSPPLGCECEYGPAVIGYSQYQTTGFWRRFQVGYRLTRTAPDNVAWIFGGFCRYLLLVTDSRQVALPRGFYTVSQQTRHELLPITSPHTDRFSKFFHC